MKRALALSLALLIVAPASLTTPAYAGPKLQAFKQRAKDLGAGTKDFLRSMGGKVAIGVVIGGLTAGMLSHTHENAREHNIPLAFSEISQIERDAKAAGDSISPATFYLTRVNESAMKVFEAYDLSYSKLRSGTQANKFAKELAIKMRTRVHTHELPDLFQELPGAADGFRLSLSSVETTSQGLKPVSSHLDRAWDESHHDNTHMETRWRTVQDRDSKGNVTGSHQESYQVEVYDNTTHTYTFTAAEGQAANAGLSGLRAKVPTLSGLPTLKTASETHAEGEYAAEKTRGVKAGSHMEKDQLAAIANTWATGATYTQNVRQLETLWNQTILADAKTWSRDVTTAHSDRYKTTSHFDSGPKELQSAKQTRSNVDEFTRRADEVLASIAVTQRNAPQLEQKIQQLLAIEIDRTQKGDSKQLAADIMKLAREMYGVNFQKGVDTKAYRAGVVVLFVMLGMILGGGGGAGAQRGTEFLRDKLGRRS